MDMLEEDFYCFTRLAIVIYFKRLRSLLASGIIFLLCFIQNGNLSVPANPSKIINLIKKEAIYPIERHLTSYV